MPSISFHLASYCYDGFDRSEGEQEIFTLQTALYLIMRWRSMTYLVDMPYSLPDLRLEILAYKEGRGASCEGL